MGIQATQMGLITEDWCSQRTTKLINRLTYHKIGGGGSMQVTAKGWILALGDISYGDVFALGLLEASVLLS